MNLMTDTLKPDELRKRLRHHAAAESGSRDRQLEFSIGEGAGLSRLLHQSRISEAPGTAARAVDDDGTVW
ncbi:MAG: hypothetical protein ACLVC5_09435 [Clostridia bacterium]